MALELRSYYLRKNRMGYQPKRVYKRRQSSLNMAVKNNQKDKAKTICFGVLKDFQ